MLKLCNGFAVLDEQVLALVLMSSLEGSDILHRQAYFFCSGNTKGIMVLAWMLWSARMLLEHEGNNGFGMDALVSVCSWNKKGIMVLAWMLWSAYALGNTNGIVL